MPVFNLTSNEVHSVSVTSSNSINSSATESSNEPSLQIEHRLLTYRLSLSNDTRQRLRRITEHRIQLISRNENEVDPNAWIQKPSLSQRCYSVLGAKGNVYNVKIGRIPSCTCPDYATRGNTCKHILFVLINVLRVSTDDILLAQKSFLSTELESIYQCADAHFARVGTTAMPMASSRVIAAYNASKDGDGEIEIESVSLGVKCKLDNCEGLECPVCFETIKESNDETTHCLVQCGNPIHKACLVEWLQNSQTKDCPLCRIPWKENEALCKALQEAQIERKASTSSWSLGHYQNLGAYSDDRRDLR